MVYSVLQRASGIPLAIYQVGADKHQICSKGRAPKSQEQVGAKPAQ